MSPQACKIIKPSHVILPLLLTFLLSCPSSYFLPPVSCFLPLSHVSYTLTHASCFLPPVSCSLASAPCLRFLPHVSYHLPPVSCHFPLISCLLPPASWSPVIAKHFTGKFLKLSQTVVVEGTTEQKLFISRMHTSG